MFTPFLLVGLLVEHNGLASGTVQKNHVIRGIPDAEVQAGIPSLCRKGFFLHRVSLLGLAFMCLSLIRYLSLIHI